MTERFKEFDLNNFVTSDDELVFLLNDALASNDAGYLLDVLGVYAKRKGLSDVSKKSTVDRAYLYKALSHKGNPGIKTLMLILNALGIRFTASLSSAPNT